MNFTGQLLIAHPNISDSFFERSVIYIYEHSKEAGAFGLVLNKSTSYLIQDVFEKRDLGQFGMDYIYQGGPVHTEACFMLHTDDWYSKTTITRNDISVSSDTFMFEKASTGNYPGKYRMFLGMASWLPGQLESEVTGKSARATGCSWISVRANPEIIFDFNGEEQWNRAVELSSQEMIDYYF